MPAGRRLAAPSTRPSPPLPLPAAAPESPQHRRGTHAAAWRRLRRALGGCAAGARAAPVLVLLLPPLLPLPLLLGLQPARLELACVIAHIIGTSASYHAIWVLTSDGPSLERWLPTACRRAAVQMWAVTAHAIHLGTQVTRITPKKFKRRQIQIPSVTLLPSSRLHEELPGQAAGQHLPAGRTILLCAGGTRGEGAAASSGVPSVVGAWRRGGSLAGGGLAVGGSVRQLATAWQAGMPGRGQRPWRPDLWPCDQATAACGHVAGSQPPARQHGQLAAL